MRRRALLSAAPAGASLLAGCSLFDDEDAGRGTLGVSETRTDPTATRAYDVDLDALANGLLLDDGSEHAVAVTTPEGVPDDVEITVGFESQPTPERPATVFVERRVPDDAAGERRVPHGRSPPLSAYEGVDPSNDHRLLLVPDEAGVPQDEMVRRDVGCWRPVLPVGPQTEYGHLDETTTATVLEPGDTVIRAYFLVTPWSRDRCLPTGQYAFTAEMGWRIWVCVFDASAPDASRFEGIVVPAFPRQSAVHWYHEQDPSLYVVPENEQVGLPSATNRFTFRNTRYRSMYGSPDAWALYKLLDGGWFPIAPLTPAEPPTRILPGESVEAPLRLFSDPDRASQDERATVGGLRSGRYAVTYPETLSPAPNSVPGEESVTPAALFEIVGPDVPLDASGAIDHTRDAGETLHVYTTVDEESVATLRLDRTERPPARTLIREQVLQREALRNALVELRRREDDVTTIAYHVDPEQIVRITPWIDPTATGLRFAFEGETYEMTYV